MMPMMMVMMIFHGHSLANHSWLFLHGREEGEKVNGLFSGLLSLLYGFFLAFMYKVLCFL